MSALTGESRGSAPTAIGDTRPEMLRLILLAFGAIQLVLAARIAIDFGMLSNGAIASRTAARS